MYILMILIAYSNVPKSILEVYNNSKKCMPGIIIHV